MVPMVPTTRHSFLEKHDLEQAKHWNLHDTIPETETIVAAIAASTGPNPPTGLTVAATSIGPNEPTNLILNIPKPEPPHPPGSSDEQ